MIDDRLTWRLNNDLPGSETMGHVRTVCGSEASGASWLFANCSIHCLRQELELKLLGFRVMIHLGRSFVFKRSLTLLISRLRNGL